jgi:hypothetical protein
MGARDSANIDSIQISSISPDETPGRRRRRAYGQRMSHQNNRRDTAEKYHFIENMTDTDP